LHRRVLSDGLHRRPQSLRQATLIVHGDDDQIVPIGAAERASKRLVPSATLIVDEGAPHGITDTHKTRLNDDTLRFLRG
jgi:non-heme chloroperoxidase